MIDEHLVDIYRAEAEALLGRMAQQALGLEAGADPATIDQLFRDVHTIKGSSGLVGFRPAADLAHAIEDVLGDLRAGRRGISADLVDQLLGGVDDLRAVVALLAAGQDAGDRAAAAIARLAAGDGGAPADAGGAADAEPLRAGGGDAAAETGAAADDGDAEAGAAADDGDAEAGAAADDGGAEAGAAADGGGAAVGDPRPPGDAPGDREALAPPVPARQALPTAEEAVRVPLARLDRLVRLAGEAVAAELALRHELAGALAADPDAAARAARLGRTLRALQDETLRTRMTTLAAVAEPLRRAARDVARAEGKLVRYEHDAERAELDRAVLDALRDPLLHLVRNAVGHGSETPAERRAAGKPETGRVSVRARRAGGQVVIEVADDGRGLDLGRLRERAGVPDADDAVARELAFRAGVSTSDAVTDVAGRGVGLDAVRAAVRALRGTVDLESRPGEGCTFTIRVPMSLAVLPCLVVGAADERYALPAYAIATVAEVAADARASLEGRTALWVGEDVVPLTPLAAVLGRPAGRRADGPAVVLAGAGGRRHALRVDELVGQRSVTVAELGRVVPPNPVVAGASVEPDGSVVLVLDAAAIVERAAGGAGAAGAAGPGDAAGHRGAAGAARRTTVLVVDDALTVRELQRSILERAGFAVRTAVDGEDALARLAEARPDLVLTDIEMPRLDGFGLVAAVRDRPELAGLPVVIVSSRADEADRRRALAAGADAYIVKRDFDEAALLGVVRDLLGAPTSP